MGFWIPETLIKHNNWVLWRLEEGKKKPYCVSSSGMASVSKPYQWTSYEDALNKLVYTDDYNGLGFVFSRDCGLVFIDLDHCINDKTGEMTDFAESIVKDFAGTYIEYSQSEQGLHIVCCGHIPASHKSSYIELYSSGRYMACTGNVYDASEPSDKQEALDRLCTALNITDHEPTVIVDMPQQDSDEAIIHKAMQGANGEQFKLLWDGLWQEMFATQSQADMRLIDILLYYSGDFAQVERLFHSSGLADRKKAYRQDYVMRTIETAASNQNRDSITTQHSVFQRKEDTHIFTEQSNPKRRKRPYWRG